MTGSPKMNQNRSGYSAEGDGDLHQQITQLLDQADLALRKARSLISQTNLTDQAEKLVTTGMTLGEVETGDLRIVEGVFDGLQMIGSDSRRYPVPPNYASKSKLVAGDILKLTISPDGSFIFKQIGPVNRRKLVGTLVEDQGKFIVSTDKKNYQVLAASISYYRAKPGDQITIVVPLEQNSEWAAVENLLAAA